MTTIQVTPLKNLHKVIGLIGAKNARPVLLKTRFGIHTFGVRFPIDVIVLDNNKIVKVAESLKPNRIFLWNPRFDTVIELPAGEIKRLKIKNKISKIQIKN